MSLAFVTFKNNSINRPGLCKSICAMLLADADVWMMYGSLTHFLQGFRMMKAMSANVSRGEAFHSGYSGSVKVPHSFERRSEGRIMI